MSSRRVLKVAEAIRQVIGMAILTELRDPRIQDVTVTSVEVSPDLRIARVNISVMGEETKQQLALTGLQHAAGFLQSKIANRIDTRYTPVLHFHLDQGVKHAMEVARILREVLPPDEKEPLKGEPTNDISEDISHEKSSGEASSGEASDS